METSLIKRSCSKGFFNWTVQIVGDANCPPEKYSGRDRLLPKETKEQAIYRILTREHDQHSPPPAEETKDAFAEAFAKAADGGVIALR